MSFCGKTPDHIHSSHHLRPSQNTRYMGREGKRWCVRMWHKVSGYLMICSSSASLGYLQWCARVVGGRPRRGNRLVGGNGEMWRVAHVPLPFRPSTWPPLDEPGYSPSRQSRTVYSFQALRMLEQRYLSFSVNQGAWRGTREDLSHEPAGH